MHKLKTALAQVYGSVIGIRNNLYDRGILRTYETQPFVVSVGNIEVGGTGKTPFTMRLAQELSARGHAVAIVTRGYKGRLKGTLQVSQTHSAVDVGDEALLMARTLEIPVIKSPDRVAGANYAYHTCGANLIVMDDAYQHRRIHRDYNICLVSADISHEWLLPAGRLREPVSSLKRADCIVHTKGAQGTNQARIVQDGLVNRFGIRADQPIKGNVFAFCGIAQPEPFFKLLAENGINMETRAFGDHHSFNRRDLHELHEQARGKDLVITTEKDLMRLDASQLDERWHALRVKMEIPDIERIIREIETRVHDRSLF